MENQLAEDQLRKISGIIESVNQLPPMKVSEDAINRKRELNLELRVQKLRTTKAVPPDFFDALKAFETESDKNKIITSLQKIYGYIASVKKSKSIMDNFKGGKLNMLSGDEQVTTLSELFSVAKEICKVHKKFIATQEKEKNLQDKPSLTNKQLASLDKHGDQKDGLKVELDKLKNEFLETLEETESSVASVGLK